MTFNKYSPKSTFFARTSNFERRGNNQKCQYLLTGIIGPYTRRNYIIFILLLLYLGVRLISQPFESSTKRNKMFGKFTGMQVKA